MLPFSSTPARSAPDELIHDIAQRAHYDDDDERALSHIRTVFRVIRHRASFEQSLRFLEMLPMPFKAIFLNDWHIALQPPAPITNMDEFADEMLRYEQQHVMPDRTEARRVLRAIFGGLSHTVGSDLLRNSLDFVTLEVRAQLLEDQPERYHYADTCIWLS